MVLGILMMVVPFMIIPAEKLGKTITETIIQIFVPIIGLLFVILSLPIIVRSKLGKNLKTKVINC